MDSEDLITYKYIRIMSILDNVDTILANGDKMVPLIEEKEDLIFGILIPGVNRVVTKQNLPSLLM